MLIPDYIPAPKVKQAQNALTLNSGKVLRWGGDLAQNTIIEATAGNYDVTFYNGTLPLPNLLYINGQGISVGIGRSAYDATNPERLVVDAGNAASANVIYGYASGNSYRQIGIKNTSNGNAASGEFTATANTGSETANYVSFGINSSAYNDAAYSIGGALAGYIFSNGGNLTVGTATAGTEIRFHTAGTTTGNLRMVITAGGNIGIQTPTPAHTLTNSSTTVGIGSGAVASNGLAWQGAFTGFAQGIYNSNSGTGAHGSFVYTASNLSTTILHEQRAGGIVPFRSWGDGFIDLANGQRNGVEKVVIGGSLYVQTAGGSSTSAVTITAHPSGPGILATGMYVESGVIKYRSATPGAAFSLVRLGGSDGLPFEIQLSAANGAPVTTGATASLITVFSAAVNGAVPKIAFFGGSPSAKPVVSGSRGGNAALASLLTALASLSILTDSTSA